MRLKNTVPVIEIINREGRAVIINKSDIMLYVENAWRAEHHEKLMGELKK